MSEKDFYKEQIQKILNEKSSKIVAQYIKKNEPILWNEILSKTSHVVSGNAMEHIRSYMEDRNSNICQYNGTQTFRDGKFRFCGTASKCKCAKESVSNSVSKKKKDRSKEDIEKENKKRENTILEKSRGLYSNNGQSEKAKCAHKDFYSDKDNIKTQVEKQENTMMELYGVKNIAQYENHKSKQNKKNNDLYGVDNHKQKHYSEELKEILFNKELFEKTLKEITVVNFADTYNINTTTVYNYIKKYKIFYEKGSSKQECIIFNFLKENGINFIHKTKSIISPLELDFYLTDYNIGIELNGLYWHSDIFKEKDYHLNKYLACKEKNIRLLMINEDEIHQHLDLIKNKILNLIGKSEKGLAARKLVVRSISNKLANNFCEKFHIQGKTGQIIYSAGAYDNDNIVGVMLFNKQRNTQDIELIRFCTDKKIHAGLFSKLLKFSIKENNFDSIISFADLRYSNGNLYDKNGFEKMSVLKPDYSYVRRNKTFHKSNFSKNAMVKKGFFTEEEIKNKTEKELTEELGLCRIYDIGKIKYVYNKKPS